MSEIKSLKKLRELAVDINSAEIIDHMHFVPKFEFDARWLDSWRKAFDAACDEIEREIAERYQLLPVDADGVPIRVGDELETAHDGKVIVEYVGECEVRVYRDGEHYRISQDEYAYTCRHVKPRTLEYVLEDFAIGVCEEDGYDKEHVRRCADEIRELMEVGA